MMTARSSRALSFSSDRPSVASSITFQMPTTVRPSPAYIAASVASQIVTDHHNAQLQLEDADADELENAIFSEQALALLNAFLDHLLFAFLSSARSPSLTTIRPAISDVLKPRLAREAMEAADEELQGLLAGEDDDEFSIQDSTAADKWDVEKVWKRTRLRIMVYTRLGELEDEDEEKYVQQERGLSMDDDDDEDTGLVSWASAIFLTSVIEYVAEQTLLVSGTAAYARMATKMRKLAQQMEDSYEPGLERLIIEEPDVEKIALNSALGRLWRTWRKRVRSPMSPTSPMRGVRPVSSFASLHHRKGSRDTIDEALRGEHTVLPEHTPTETEIASNIPLPLGDNDVNEIEVPGLARTFEDGDENSGRQTPVPRRVRPSSVIVLSHALLSQRASNKERPLSMPMRPTSPFAIPQPAPSEDGDQRFETALERMPESESVSESDDRDDVERQREATRQQLEESPEPDADASMVAFAAATGMGFRRTSVDPAPTNAIQASLIQTSNLERGLNESEAANAGEQAIVPAVLHGKRMSIEKPGPPGVVRTFSARSSRLRSSQQTPVTTPKLSQHNEGQSYLNDDPSDDEIVDDHRAIGVARTSDIPIRSTPTPPIESPRSKGKGLGLGGYVEVQPRQVAPTSAPRSTTMPDAKSVVPDRSVDREEPQRSQPPSNVVAGIISPLRNSDSPRSASRGGSLPSLKEVASNPIKAVADVAARRGSSISNSPKRSPPRSIRDGSMTGTERQGQRTSIGEYVRSQPVSHDRSPSEKASLKRVVSSASSAKRSTTATVVTSGRDSSGSIRSRNLSGRMSEEDREREFDSLVKGQDTVKFTLTPQNMRALDVSFAPS